MNNNASTSATLPANTIVLNNSAPTSADFLANNNGSDGGNNLFGQVVGIAAPLKSSIYDIADTSTWLDTSPRANGGPFETIALLEVNDSPAVDRANAAIAPMYDQRGVERSGLPDIGAYELQENIPEGNVVKITADRSRVRSSDQISFTLAARLLEADAINTIEAVFTYDAEKFDAVAGNLPGGFDVKSIVVNTEKGQINMLLGVVGEKKTISYSDFETLAQTTLTVKEGFEPEIAQVTLTSFGVYSKGFLMPSTMYKSFGYSIIHYGTPFDVNGDGAITSADLSLVLYYFGATRADSDWGLTGSADLNDDGIVDMTDVMILVEAIQASL